MAFSNNDYYVGMIGAREIQIYDSRSGKMKHKQALPSTEMYRPTKAAAARAQATTSLVAEQRIKLH